MHVFVHMYVSVCMFGLLVFNVPIPCMQLSRGGVYVWVYSSAHGLTIAFGHSAGTPESQKEG